MAQSIATSGPYIARTTEEITQALIDYFVMMGTSVTDMSVGSVIRTEFEAIAQTVEQFYADQATQLQDAITQSAFSAFNFTPLPSDNAVGYLIFYVPAPGLSATQTFLKGTTWQPDGMNTLYATTVDFTIPMTTPGRWHVPAKALLLGSLGNLAGNAGGDLLYPYPGIIVTSEDGAGVGVDKLEPGDTTLGTPLAVGFINGRDPETPLEMRSRFTAFLSSLHRSTPDALEYGASLAVRTDDNGNVLEQAVLTKTIDVNIDHDIEPLDGHARVYIYNGIGSPGGMITSGDLVANAQDKLDGVASGGNYTAGYKASGITTTAYAALERIATVAVTVIPVGRGTGLAINSDFIRAAVQDAIGSYFKSLKIGEKFYLSAMLRYIVSVPGVTAATVDSLSFSPSVSNTGDAYSIPTNAIAILGGTPTVTVST